MQFCTSLNQIISIHQTLPASLPKRKLPQFPLFDCYEERNEIQTARRPAFIYTRGAPLIANDNSEFSEGRLSKMAGSFNRPAVTQLSASALYWWVRAYSAGGLKGGGRLLWNRQKAAIRNEGCRGDGVGAESQTCINSPETRHRTSILIIHMQFEHYWSECYYFSDLAQSHFLARLTRALWPFPA